MTASPDIVRGLLTGIAREAARGFETTLADGRCRDSAWFIANAGFGLTYQDIGAAAGVSKQAVGQAVSKIVDCCEQRAFERKLMAVAAAFGVNL